MNHIKILIILIFLSNLAYAADLTFQQLSRNQQNALMDLRQEINTIRDLNNRTIISANLAQTTEKYFVLKYQSEKLSSLSVDNIRHLLSSCAQNTLCKRRSIIADLQGFFTFVNIMWFIGIALLLLGLGTLIYLYRRLWLHILTPIKQVWQAILSLVPIIWRWVQTIPVSVYEVLLAMISFLLMFNAIGGDTTRSYIALTGAFILVACIILSIYLHEQQAKAWGKKLKEKKISPLAVITGFVFLAWSAAAIYQQSQLVGIFAIMALMASLGFTVMVGRLCYFFGFTKYRQIPRTVIAAFLLLLVYGLAHVGKIDLGQLRVFETGVFYVASPIYFIGLLIVSSRYFHTTMDTKYIYLQLLTIASGIMALFVGSVYEINALRGFGGTFFFIYLIEKYTELPWNRKKLAWPIFILGALLFAMAYVINEYPEYFFI